jgi:hypothetical protein
MRNAACNRPCFRSTRVAGIATFASLQLAVGAVAAEIKTFENAELRYSITLPAGCRYQEGPGTLEAVCSPEFDPVKSLICRPRQPSSSRLKSNWCRTMPVRQPTC